jgi:AcrR family transcriptional regulator
MSIKNKKEDPRTTRSKEMLKNAVFALLSEDQSISTLTVQKVAAKAGLNRTTFYLHYHDVYDLLTKLNAEIIKELSDKIERLLHAEDLTEKQQLTQLLDYLYIHRKYLAALFNVNQFEEQLFSLLRRLVETRRKNTKEELPSDYVSIDIKTASIAGIIMWWMRKGIHFSSEYIADQIYLMYRGR